VGFGVGKIGDQLGDRVPREVEQLDAGIKKILRSRDIRYHLPYLLGARHVLRMRAKHALQLESMASFQPIDRGGVRIPPLRQNFLTLIWVIQL